MYQEDTVVMTTKFNKTYTPGFIRHFLTKQMGAMEKNRLLKEFRQKQLEDKSLKRIISNYKNRSGNPTESQKKLSTAYRKAILNNSNKKKVGNPQ